MASATTICPGCSRPGKLPLEFAGKRVKCRHCGHHFVARTEAEKPPEIPLAGRTDYENFTFGIGGDRDLAERATKAGTFTGFRQLPTHKSE